MISFQFIDQLNDLKNQALSTKNSALIEDAIIKCNDFILNKDKKDVTQEEVAKVYIIYAELLEYIARKNDDKNAYKQALGYYIASLEILEGISEIDVHKDILIQAYLCGIDIYKYLGEAEKDINMYQNAVKKADKALVHLKEFCTRELLSVLLLKKAESLYGLTKLEELDGTIHVAFAAINDFFEHNIITDPTILENAQSIKSELVQKINEYENNDKNFESEIELNFEKAEKFKADGFKKLDFSLLTESIDYYKKIVEMSATNEKYELCEKSIQNIIELSLFTAEIFSNIERFRDAADYCEKYIFFSSEPAGGKKYKFEILKNYSEAVINNLNNKLGSNTETNYYFEEFFNQSENLNLGNEEWVLYGYWDMRKIFVYRSACEQKNIAVLKKLHNKNDLYINKHNDLTKFIINTIFEAQILYSIEKIEVATKKFSLIYELENLLNSEIKNYRIKYLISYFIEDLKSLKVDLEDKFEQFNKIFVECNNLFENENEKKHSFIWLNSIKELADLNRTIGEKNIDCEFLEKSIYYYNQIINTETNYSFESYFNLAECLRLTGEIKENCNDLENALKYYRLYLEKINLEKNQNVAINSESGLISCLLDLYMIKQENTLFEEASVLIKKCNEKLDKINLIEKNVLLKYKNCYAKYLRIYTKIHKDYAVFDEALTENNYALQLLGDKNDNFSNWIKLQIGIANVLREKALYTNDILSYKKAKEIFEEVLKNRNAIEKCAISFRYVIYKNSADTLYEFGNKLKDIELINRAEEYYNKAFDFAIASNMPGISLNIIIINLINLNISLYQITGDFYYIEKVHLNYKIDNLSPDYTELYILLNCKIYEYYFLIKNDRNYIKFMKNCLNDLKQSYDINTKEKTDYYNYIVNKNNDIKIYEKFLIEN